MNAVFLIKSAYMNKYGYITFTKTVNLFIVVLFHCMVVYVPNPIYLETANISSDTVGNIAWILNYIMVPAFVICSGFLMANSFKNHDRSIPVEIKRKAERLLIPYYLYGTLWLVPLETFFDINMIGREENYSLWKTFLRMLTGQFTDHLWFLLILFWSSLFIILLKPLYKRGHYVIMGLLSFAAGYAIQFFAQSVPYFKISQVGPFIICIFAGVMLYKAADKLEKLSYVLIIFVILGSLAIVLGCHFFLMDYYNYWICIADLAGGITGLFTGLLLWKTKPVKWIGKTKVYIYTERHNLNMYLFGNPFPFIYFMALQPLLEKNIPLMIIVDFLLSILSIYSVVTIQDVIKSLYRKISGERDGKEAT